MVGGDIDLTPDSVKEIGNDGDDGPGFVVVSGQASSQHFSPLDNEKGDSILDCDWLGQSLAPQDAYRRRIPPALASTPWKLLVVAAAALFVMTLLILFKTFGSAPSILNISYEFWGTVLSSSHGQTALMCPQVAPLIPTDGPNAEILEKLEGVYHTETFKNRSATWLSGAVQIPTESYDDLGPVGTDPRWNTFPELHAYLRRAFPLTFTQLVFTPINTHNIVLHWQGTDDSLKPLLLTGHQDVVPVDPTTLDQWMYPPYSGFFDGTYIFGRGSRDDKSGLIGLLASFESLLEVGFKPRRTIVLASGIDEEAGGEFGAGQLGVYLEESYGTDSFAMLVDEGGNLEDQYGIFVALPDIGEKGYLDVEVELLTPGGHSSIPPNHTSIGLLALAIALIEQNPSPYQLSRISPFYATMQCVAENGHGIPADYLDLVKKSLASDKALKKLESLLLETGGDQEKARLTTTQAVDIVRGGVKVNALPERASAIINHRISVDSSVNELMARLTALLQPFAEEYRLGFVSFEKTISPLTPKSPCAHSNPGTFSLFTSTELSEANATTSTLRLSEAYHSALEPAPITPTDTAAYKILSGSIRATHARTTLNDPKAKQQEMTVSPNLAKGNTDTRFYWNLTRNIFRYNHRPVYSLPFSGGAHTVNEAIPVSALVEEIRFFTLLILNADESNEL